MARLSLLLLGPFQALLDGRPVTGFESAKTRALLAYLAAEGGRPHPREAVAELLWPEQPHGIATANLRHALATLRKTIADQAADPPYLLITHETLQLNPASDAFVDLTRFAACTNPEQPATLQSCQKAAELYRGRFLAGLSLAGCPEFESWIVLTRERVDYHAGQMLARLVRHAVEQGDLAQAVSWTQRQLDLEPWNEEVYQQLMWLLAHSGQRAAALHQYDVCVRMLAAEQGVEPQPSTRTLAERIRAGGGDLDALLGQDGQPLAAPSAPGQPASAHNLPPEPTPFVGRARELAQIAANLDHPDCRLLTIVGPGGVGKTRLAIEAARAQVGRLRHGVWFVDLASVAAADMVPGIILRALAAPDRGSGEARRLLRSYLRDKSLLIVLDNFEHLLASTDLLTETLHAAPALKVLVTSRIRLNLRDEWLQPLVGLDTPAEELHEPSLLDRAAPAPASPRMDLDAYDATRLFLQCVRRLRPAYQPAPADVQLIAHICRQLEGMPLGIELAASWTRVLSLPELAAEIEGSLNILSTSLHDAPARHRSMHVVFSQSWLQLSARERCILAQLSVFHGGFTRSAAEVVAGASLLELSDLVDKSWVRAQPSGRYVLHELTRQYCAEMLSHAPTAVAEETADQVRRRHCLHYGAFLHEQMRRTNYHHDVVDTVMAEFGNLQAAWDWTVELGDMNAALDMIISLYFVGEMLGWYRFVIGVYESAAARLAPLIAPDQPDPGRRQAVTEMLIWLAYCRGHLYNHLGLLERARTCVDTSFSLLETLAPGKIHEELTAFTRWLNSVLLNLEGNCAESHRRCHQLLDYFRVSEVDFVLYGHVIGARFWQAHALGHLAFTAHLMGDYRAAEQWLREAIALRTEIGEVRFCAFNFSLLARILELTGNYEAAEDQAHESLRLGQACGDQISTAAARLALGRIEAAQGRHTLGREHLQQSLATGRQTGHHQLLMDSLVALGHIELALEHPKAAREFFEEAIASFVRLETIHSNKVAGALLGLGWAALADHDRAAARRLFQEALDAPGGAAWEAMDATAGLALLAAAEGRMNEAAELRRAVLHAPATAHQTRVRLEEIGLPQDDDLRLARPVVNLPDAA